MKTEVTAVASRGRTLVGMAIALAAFAVFPVSSAAQFSYTDVTGWGSGAAGSSGGTIYPFPNPYVPQTLAPMPEITGDYSVHYLYSPQTGQTYADPMYYHGLRALERWEQIQPRTPRVSRKSRTKIETRTTTVRSAPTAKPEPVALDAAPRERMPSLPEVIDK